ncbi:cyanophycinase [Ottowia flava]|uniref:Cyanophycinase n=2 Tax=Ottowia TaxID=219181 RepID=A0ABW4KU18_9BURK
MPLYRFLLLLLLPALLVACGGGDDGDDAPPTPATYEHFWVGNPDAKAQTAQPLEPSTMIMGGGPADVDSAFQWMIARSGVRPGTGGRLVVLRAVRNFNDDYNPYVFYSDVGEATSGSARPGWVGGAAMGLTSVETLIVPDRDAANDPHVNEVLRSAQVVFIAGGDQANYIRYWKNTALHSSLNALMTRNVPIGGTSAGLAVLGQFDFSALNDSVSSAEALADPFNHFMTLDPDPLSLSGGFLVPGSLKNTILDSHFDGRNRMGRLMTFVSRLVAPIGTSGCAGGILAAGTSPQNGARAIGVSEDTALLIEGDGLRTPYTGRRATNPGLSTEGAIYFVRPLQAPTVCARGTPLSAPAMAINKLTDDTVFNLSDWSGLPTYLVDVVNGVLSRDPY